MSSTHVSDAARWMESTESRLLDLSIETQQADWVQATYITEDTQALASRAYARLIAETVRLAKEATRRASE
ncbi:MAG: M2 family metallopeptidase, partial [Thermoplasmata archaeon]|nr:M2 family metallopeptidase [Thermoplasmata archaeon]